ncbi:MAG: universal stress protein [Reichenbachiella sp.]|uniref:universal stress protein n=1 Tax=Reichenbachiella sp. TaxID=2184521 RepID=UPI0032636343
MNRILIPVDFSSSSDKAAAFGIRIANAIKADVTFIYVSPVPAGGDVTFFIDEPIYEASKSRATQEFEKLKSRIPELKGTNYDFKFEIGFPVKSIAKTVEDIDADLIILGSSGVNNKLDEIFGSTAYKTMKHARCPVLIVPEGFEPTVTKHIAIATNFKAKIDFDIVEIMYLIAKALNSEIHVVTVVDEPKPHRDKFIKQQMTLWAEILKEVRHHFHFIENGNVEERMLDYVEKNGIEMLVVMPSKLNFVENLFHKSVSKKLAYHTQVPLLA